MEVVLAECVVDGVVSSMLEEVRSLAGGGAIRSWTEQ